MGLVLGILEQALLLGPLVVFTTYILWHTTRTTSRQELALRLMSLSADAVVVGTQAEAGAGVG